MSLAAAGLSFSYPGKRVLEGIRFEDVPRGRLTALLGPNAAGKSTLFRCAAGLLAPRSGTLSLDGRDLAALDPAGRIEAVCFMPQAFASHAALTVFEVVLLARKRLEGWRVTDADLAAVERMLIRLDIEHLAGRHIGELSGGQQQMVSLCQALVRPAEVYLLDEPTSALDLRRQLEVMETVKAIARERDAVIVAAMHDLNLAVRFADHLLLMRDGRLLAAGPCDSILASPALAETYEVDIEVRHTEGGSVVTARLPHA